MKSSELQTVVNIETGELLEKVSSLKKDGWRLIQILCISNKENLELSYSFGLDYHMQTLRLASSITEKKDLSSSSASTTATVIPSITPIFGAAFLYENEIRDLFGAPIQGIEGDWKGKILDSAGNMPFRKVSIVAPSSERSSGLRNGGLGE